VFILENSQQVNIGYFGAHGHLPLGVALLLAAVLGILLVVIPGAGRMIQLRRTARRHRRADAAAAKTAAQPAAPASPAPADAGTAPAPDSADAAGSPPDGIIRT
jgi:lipopolysaccharide assembly protein A